VFWQDDGGTGVPMPVGPVGKRFQQFTTITGSESSSQVSCLQVQFPIVAGLPMQVDVNGAAGVTGRAPFVWMQKRSRKCKPD